MPSVFTIDDELHCEYQGEFLTFDTALLELKRLAEVPWDQVPNRAPCRSWKTCGRLYKIMEFDRSKKPWSLLSQKNVVEISSKGVKWFIEL